ncbi:hypothetical protein BD769DRAFT_1498658 [Suillus cothurnatus]|nr:hypothetical protein BD769DRAFT_1498658 [Suillus cothurnatus]
MGRISLQVLGDKKCLPSMPKPGEVDFIYGGSPCQSFSKMNHAKAASVSIGARPMLIAVIVYCLQSASVSILH